MALLGQGLAEGPSNQVLVVDDENPLGLNEFLRLLCRGFKDGSSG
jgi:hypothetical protein